MTKQLFLSALAVAALSLTACSSEPSDWRPDKKVSVDTVDPGTRSSDSFDAQEPNESVNEHKGTSAHKEVTAESDISANAMEEEVTKSPELLEEMGAERGKDSTDTTPSGQKAHR